MPKFFIFFILLLFLEISAMGSVYRFLAREFHPDLGFWANFFTLFGSGFLGAKIAKTQGRLLLQKLTRDGHLPQEMGAALLDGVLLFMGALLLIFPGYITDTLGVLLLVPFVRTLIRKKGARRLDAFLRRTTQRGFGGSIHMRYQSWGGASSSKPPPNKEKIIDVDAEDSSEKNLGD